jgi:hypothetical protein
MVVRYVLIAESAGIGWLTGVCSRVPKFAQPLKATAQSASNRSALQDVQLRRREWLAEVGSAPLGWRFNRSVRGLRRCAFESRSKRQADAKVRPWERAVDNLDGAPMRLDKL